MQRLQHSLVLLFGDHYDGPGILTCNMKRRTTIAHLVHVFGEMRAKFGVRNMTHVTNL